jgi:PAS domain S-box-containing protein
MHEGVTSNNADFALTPGAEGRGVPLVADARVDDRRLNMSIYQAIFEHSLDGVMFTAPDGRIFAANGAACALLRMSEDEIVAAGREGLMDPTDPVWDDAVEQRRRDGQGRAKLRMRRGDGTVFLADVTSVIFQMDGETRACVFLRDTFDQGPARRDFAKADTPAGPGIKAIDRKLGAKSRSDALAKARAVGRIA